jgi:acetyltransferase-like isoleucine patch superfamily enzyme
MIRRVIPKVKRAFFRPIIRFFLPVFYDTYVSLGNGKLVVGERSALANSVLNLSSGDITIGDRVIFGYNCMLLTGTHLFIDGKRASFDPDRDDGSWGGGNVEVPKSGRDIKIGSGTFVGSGAIIIGPSSIGEHSIIAAGSVVKGNFPNNSFIKGNLSQITK